MFFLVFLACCFHFSKNFRMEKLSRFFPLLGQLKAHGALLVSCYFFNLVFMGPGVLALQIRHLVIFLPRQQLTSWQSRQWQCVSLLSFYTFCFKMQDFLMVCLGFSKSLFTDPERCQTHALKNAGQVYMCLKIHHHVRAYLMFWANFEADLIAVCSVLLFAKKVAANRGQNLSSLPLV